MVVFTEWFPIDKEFVVDRARLRKIKEESEAVGEVHSQVQSTSKTSQKSNDLPNVTENFSCELANLNNVSTNVSTKNVHLPEVRSQLEIQIAQNESVLSTDKRAPNFQSAELRSVSKQDERWRNLSLPLQRRLHSKTPSNDKSSPIKRTISLPSTPSAPKYQVPKAPKTTQGPSVIRMLEEAKQKRSRKLSEIPIPVINLKF